MSDDSPYADTCFVADDLTAAAAADDDDYGEAALVIDESATEQFELLDSVDAECSTLAENTDATEQSASFSCADDDGTDADAAKKRQLWIVVRHHLSPSTFTSGNRLTVFAFLSPVCFHTLMCGQQYQSTEDKIVCVICYTIFLKNNCTCRIV